jgi:peptide/nickel transport system substrate-binding protein
MKRLHPLIFALATALLITSCKTESGSTATTLSDALAQAWNFTETDDSAMNEREAAIARLPRERTLFLVGFQWGTPFSFNPLGSWPDFPIRPEFNLMYEQLTVFNSMTNEIEPLIGRIDESNNDFVSVILNPAARWSDGRRLTSADVLFTYNLNLTNSDAPCSYILGVISHLTVDTVMTTVRNENGDSINVVMEERVFVWVDKEDRNNPLSVLDLISTVPIWPQHVFEPLLRAAGGRIADVVRDPMSRPQVVSGPYNYFMHSNEKIVIRRRDDYWGNDALRGGRLPAPEFIIHPIFKGNEHASTALRRGDLDISSNFIPRVWRHKTVHTWFDGPPFYKPGAIPMFIINTTQFPLNNKHFRRAMAFAINYEDVRNLAVSGYSTEIQSGLIMPFSAEAQFFDEDDVQRYGATRFDPEAAKRELELGGFTPVWDRRGNLSHVLDANGDTVPPIGIMSPSGWTDFESVVRIAVDGMRAVGIDVRPNFVDASRYFSVKETGDFDLLFDTPASMRSKSTPWARFEVVMSTRNFRPIGQRMQNNAGRWNDPSLPNHIPQVDSLLQAIPLMNCETELKEAYTKLNRIFMQEQPTIPVVYRPEEFYSFSTRWWTNFPTESNPYAPPRMPVASAGTRMLWEIVPTGGR